MPVAILMEFPGRTAEDYGRVMEQLGADFVPPEGAISHVLVAMEDARALRQSSRSTARPSA
jgi:hypothetical protein